MKLESRNNVVTLSVYVQKITAKLYDEKTETITTKIFYLYNEKVPSDNVLKGSIEEQENTTVLKVTVELDKELSGLYEMSHETFLKSGKRTGELRAKKSKEDK